MLTGSILNIETLRVKYDDRASKCLDTERMCWVDCGRDDRIYLFATRVYYVVGKPAFEVIGESFEILCCKQCFSFRIKF